MNTTEREARAARRRQSILLNRTTLKRAESDLTPVSGLDAMALVQQLTRETWALAGKPTIAGRKAREFRVRSVEARGFRRTDDLSAENYRDLDGRGVYRNSTGVEAVDSPPRRKVRGWFAEIHVATSPT